MKKIILFLSLCFTATSFASIQLKTLQIDQEMVIDTIKNQIGEQNTCLDEYLLREKQLKKFLIWAPPLTIVGVPVVAYTGGLVAAGVASAAGVSGWGAMGYAIVGVVVPATGVAVSFLTLETIKAVQFANTRKMTKIIIASQEGLLDSKVIRRLTKRYNTKYPNDNLSSSELAEIVVSLDNRGDLCNGEIRNKSGASKLRQLLARRSHLMKYIHNNLLKYL
jgi:hypothetical protein